MDGLTLKPYQLTGRDFLAGKAFACLWDVPGLGKTAQSLRALDQQSEQDVVVVCPAHLKGNWRNEIAKWVPDCKATFHIVSVDNLKTLPDVRSPVVIIDEAHYLKNPETRRWKSYVAWSHRVAPKKQWLLTGTPHPTAIFDLWAQFRLSFVPAVRDLLGDSLCRFNHRYGTWKRNQFGASCIGLKAEGTRIMHEISKRCCLRRSFSDVGLQLPELIYHEIPQTVPNDEFVRAVEHRCKMRSMSVHNPNSWLSNALVVSSLNKVNTVLKVMDDIPENERVLVFGKHREPLQAVSEGLRGRCAMITAETAKPKRDKWVKAWRDGDIRTLLTTHKVMGTGLTLTEGCHAVILEFDWSIDDIRQSVARLHRLGQKRPVNVWVPYVHGTADEIYLRNIRRKRRDSDAFRKELRALVDREIRSTQKETKNGTK